MGLLTRNLGELQSYARRLTRKHSEANDLVQEACRRALESRARFKAGSDMRAWLCCILRNFHRDRLRRSARETLIGDWDGSFPAPAPEVRPCWAMVSDDDLALALASLRPQYQRAYVLHTIDGYTYQQIARALHVPPSTVGTRILRARQFLRKFLLQRIESPSSSRSSSSSSVAVAAPAFTGHGDVLPAPRSRASARGRASGSPAAHP
jgi:RNA polymerase sigma-70 factor (ECF subfamily)